MSTSLDLKVGFVVVSNDDCSIQGYSLGADPDPILYDVVKHCLSQKEDLCTNMDKYSHSSLHTNIIDELCNGES